jgi:hypothetical protein
MQIDADPVDSADIGTRNKVLVPLVNTYILARKINLLQMLL